jgi:hypothetical protein
VAAPFGPNGELEVADVVTPAIGGTVEFYRWEEDALSLVAGTGDYTSHVIGTRYLDMAVASDFDGSGYSSMLLLPNQAYRAGWNSAYRRRCKRGLDVACRWNCRYQCGRDGFSRRPPGCQRRQDGVLRIWQPKKDRRMAGIEIGQVAPTASLESSSGEQVSLATSWKTSHYTLLIFLRHLG